MLIEIWEEKFYIRQSESINVGMVDVAEGEVGGKNQSATHQRARVEMREDEFTTREG